MDELVKIGEFAKIIGTTTKTLRYYEEIGIFLPVYKDPITNYRYYHLQQLKEAYTLISLKESGIPIKNIGKTYSKDKLKELFVEANKRLEDEISRLIKLKESVENRIASIEEKDRYNGEVQIDIRELEERNFLIYRFSPIDEIDGTEIYKRALEFQRVIKDYRLPFLFKGALLSLDALKENNFLLNSLIYEVEDPNCIKKESLYSSSKGRYLCIKYKGYTKDHNKKIMKLLNDYMKENSLIPTGEIIGFSHSGAHTNSYKDDYLSEIQVKIKAT